MQSTNGALASLDRPAALRSDAILRRRLVGLLAQRFDKRVTVVRAGPGFGKTTLLAHALDQNDLDPAGVDIWIDLSTFESHAGNLLDFIAARLGATADRPSLDAVVRAVWRRAPRQVALVFDNVHEVTTSVDRAVFEQLLAVLPTNGHVVVCGRSEPPFRYDHLEASGDALFLGEADLAFDHADIEAFAHARNVRVAELGDTGWPALLELRAAVGSPLDPGSIIDQICAGLGPIRLDALKRVALLGRFDDALVRQVTDFESSAEQLVDGLPLTSRRKGGEVELHALWRGWLPPLPDAVVKGTRRALGDALSRRGDLPAAFLQYIAADHREVAAQILREVAIDYGLHHSLATRQKLLGSMPPAFASSPAAKLIEADVALITQRRAATEATTDARLAALRLGDAELEAHALLRLSELAWVQRDIEGLRRLYGDLAQLRARDPGPVAAIRGMVEMWLALSNDRRAVELDPANLEAAADYPPTAVHVEYNAALVASLDGDASRAFAGLHRVLPQLRGRHADRARWLELVVRFQLGEMDDSRRAEAAGLVEAMRDDGDTHLFVEAAAAAAIFYLSAGDTEPAVELILAASQANDSLPDGAWGRAMMTLAQASLVVYEGDDKPAADLIDAVLPERGPFDGVARHVFRNVLALTYTLVPRSRSHLDASEGGDEHALALSVGRALVALRERSDPRPAAGLPWSDVARLRAWALEPHLAELALAAMAAGETGAESALEVLRHDPYRALARVADRHRDPIAKKAASLLAKSPRRPALPLRIDVLGPMRIHVGDTVLPATKVRGRVVDFLQLLVDRRRISRATVLETLWPGLEGDRGRNNMRVNLTHLVKLLEPERPKSSPPWFVRSEGDIITLALSAHHELDVDEFEESIRRATRDDRAGLPDAALEGFMRACELYRGDYLLESAGGDVGSENRVRLRLIFSDAANRAAELLAASDRADEAALLAHRAVAAEPLAERGHIALISALRAAGRDADAEAAGSRCRQLLHEAGLGADGELKRLLG